MAHPLQTMCLACKHLDRDQDSQHVCNAFQEGIPDEIWTNRHDHHNPYPGDNGIRFEIMAIQEREPARQRERAS